MDLTEKESLLSSPSHFNRQWSTFFPATIERSRKPESPGLAILRGDKKRTRGNSKYGYYVMGTCASPLPPLSKNKGIDSWNSARRADKTREGVSLLSPPIQVTPQSSLFTSPISQSQATWCLPFRRIFNVARGEMARQFQCPLTIDSRSVNGPSLVIWGGGLVCR